LAPLPPLGLMEMNPPERFFYFVQNEAGFRVTDQDIEIQRPHELRNKSICLGELVKQGTTRILLQTNVAANMDLESIRYVVQNLQQDRIDCDNPDLETLAKRCSVLLQYACMSSGFEYLWAQLQDNYQRREQQYSCRPHPVELLTAKQKHDLVERRWRWKGWSSACCHRLLSVAIVLLLRGLLEAELVTAVWASNRDPDPKNATIPPEILNIRGPCFFFDFVFVPFLVPTSHRAQDPYMCTL
jgi:hypothetical protein